VVLDHLLRDIAPGPVSLSPPERHFPGFERRKIILDLLYLLLDVLDVSLEIDGPAYRASNHCAFHCTRKTSKL